MSLSAHDRQELDAIQEELAASDPRLAGMLSTFSRLAAGEAMPVRKPLRAGRPPTVVHDTFGLGLRRSAGRGSRGPKEWRRFLRVSALAVWLVISVALITTGVLLSHRPTGNATCTRWVGTTCAGQAPAAQQAGP